MGADAQELLEGHRLLNWEGGIIYFLIANIGKTFSLPSKNKTNINSLKAYSLGINISPLTILQKGSIMAGLQIRAEDTKSFKIFRLFFHPNTKHHIIFGLNAVY